MNPPRQGLTETRLSIPLSDGSSVAAGLLRAITGQDGDLLVLAHGAGQDMDSEFMRSMAGQLAASGCSVLRFNFQYMQIARDTGRRRPPDRAAKLEQCWREVADYARATYQPRRLLLGGKSMGGRIASHIAASGYRCDGLLFLGYPLHPPGKPERLRSDHLAAVHCPMLFVQGSRDRLCQLPLLTPILAALPITASLHRIEGGDHSLVVLKRLQRSPQDVFAEVAEAFTGWRATSDTVTTGTPGNGQTGSDIDKT